MNWLQERHFNFMNRRILFLIVLLPVAVGAQTLQNDFVREVQKDVAGWGKLVINQDSRLTRLVNKDTIVAPTNKEEKDRPADSTKQKVPAKIPNVSEESNETVSRPAKLRRYKISGYRVQIYAGNNSRNSRIEAEKTAQRFKGYFPKVPAYTHFYPPRWVCRVGDFKTSEQAQAFMQQVQQLKAFSGLTVVKTAIQVVYRSEGEE